MPQTLEQVAQELIAENHELEQCEDIKTKLAKFLVLSQIIPADGVVLDCEINKTSKIIARRFGIKRDFVESFIKRTEFNRATDIPLEELASRISKKLDNKSLQTLIRDLWDVALSDNELHHDEEALIYKISDMLGIRRRDVIAQQEKCERFSPCIPKVVQY